MQIKKATLSDVKELVKIWNSFVKEHDNTVIKKSPEKKIRRNMVHTSDVIFEKWISKCIRSKLGYVIIAIDNNKIIGYMLCTIKKYDEIFKLKYYGSINDIYIMKKYRGKGISSKLKDESIKWFKSKKIKYISLSFNSENSLPYKIYKKWGFKDEYTEMWKEI
ncbi:GNAT family N-acetyltransferase [archaeon]|jgi:ribosomal protein S18 acetylase RimI-like enzyme|nr:GNAT family N-acetyltransferase [archaeon]MBT4351122.1 GNAT family N-acetyltransferase [archaeon]MBT4648076.1 GNAT family N-acetyltransferase [archaeon]MBT6822514.1 GNAT family N-acetyltransferase [archaeon]MBT7392515.1 GNAT family N-acetyltransferase [archaeon]